MREGEDRRLPDRETQFSRITVEKPGELDLNAIKPTGIAGIRNTPVSDVRSVRRAPVSTCVAVTVTPGSAPPL